MPSAPIAALDFDGVLCNSARETAVSAWRAGRSLWPEWDCATPPREYVDRFVRVRPYLETGYQAVVMMRMVVDGLEEGEFRDHLPYWCERWMGRLGMSREDLVACFGAARDRWIDEDLESWLACHDFYAGVVAALRSVQSRVTVYILTTKQERFVRLLLKAAGVSFADERIFGLESGLTKETILARFLREDPERPLHFVEDRAGTLRRVLDRGDLRAVRLYYAMWGYGTGADRAWATAHPRVTVWALNDFASFE